MIYKDTTDDIMKMIPGEHYRLVWDSGLHKDHGSVNAIVEFISINITNNRHIITNTVTFKTILLNLTAKGQYRLEVGKETRWPISEGSESNYWEDL